MTQQEAQPCWRLSQSKNTNLIHSLIVCNLVHALLSPSSPSSPSSSFFSLPLPLLRPYCPSLFLFFFFFFFFLFFFFCPSLPPFPPTRLLEVVPTVKDPNVRVAAATLRSPTIDPHIQIEIDSSREGMWLLKHYCTPANPVRVREVGGEMGRKQRGRDGEGRK